MRSYQDQVTDGGWSPCPQRMPTAVWQGPLAKGMVEHPGYLSPGTTPRVSFSQSMVKSPRRKAGCSAVGICRPVQHTLGYETGKAEFPPEGFSCI